MNVSYIYMLIYFSNVHSVRNLTANSVRVDLSLHYPQLVETLCNKLVNKSNKRLGRLTNSPSKLLQGLHMVTKLNKKTYA